MTDSSTRKGDVLESKIFELLTSEIESDRFWAKRECCKIYWKKGYYSKDRGSNIIFDISIEVFLPGSETYSLLVLIECKNYKHPVKVDDAEEFFTKVQQVAASNSKAVIATSSSFQSGVLKFAKSKGMGLIRCFELSSLKWELSRSPSYYSGSVKSKDFNEIELGLSSDTYQSSRFDLYMQSPKRFTNIFWDFFEDVISSSGVTGSHILQISNSREALKSIVQFRHIDELEGIALRVLNSIEYTGGQVDLAQICRVESDRSGLIVTIHPYLKKDCPPPITLGRISFAPLHIEIFGHSIPSRSRDRFTLAHELAHYLLDHGRYLTQETCDEADYDFDLKPDVDSGDIARMEYQANALAACLLMPKSHVLESFKGLAKALNLGNRGFGPLYVDNQPCNLQNFNSITNDLMVTFGVSRSAAKIRMESLGLLKDNRKW